MNTLATRIISLVLTLAWFSTFIFKLMYPLSSWLYYMGNFNILMQIAVWFGNILMIVAGWAMVAMPHIKTTEMVTAASDAKKKLFHRVSRALDLMMLLFLGITGVSWSAFAAIGVNLIISALFLSILCENGTEAKKPTSDPGSVH